MEGTEGEGEHPQVTGWVKQAAGHLGKFFFTSITLLDESSFLYILPRIQKSTTAIVENIHSDVRHQLLQVCMF